MNRSPANSHQRRFFSASRRSGWHIAALVLTLALVSCQFPFAPGASRGGPTETPDPGGQPAPTENAISMAEQAQGNGETPLRFTFPTPGPNPISLWRPPLYDTPWALSPNDHFYFNRPIAPDYVNWPIPDYRYGAVFEGSDMIHTGVDIPVPMRTPIIAAQDGRVIWAGYGLYYGTNDPEDPYGLAVTIRHHFGWQGHRLYTVYAHMDEIVAKDGQEVKTGDLIGYVGITGLTTGPHLHFEVRWDRNSFFNTLNPELWMAPPQGWGVLVGRVLNTNGSYLTEQDIQVRNMETGKAWIVRTYAPQPINSDPYYDENLVLGDLPAGKYEIIIDYLEKRYTNEIEIHPGAVSYFTFRGKLYFNTDLPSGPTIDDLLGEKAPDQQ